MAIYHCSLRTFSRSEGHSAVAAAAYRSGSMLKDERSGRLHRYHKRTGVADTFIGPQAKASEEAEDDEDSKDGEGKKGSAGGASGKGSGDAFPPKIAKAKDGEETETKKREVQYKTIDHGRRRSDFVDEIKRLNERRAAFSDIPLKEQIIEIEKLIEKLDHRVHQLETLKERSGFGHRILATFTKLAELSKDLILGRETHREAVKLSDTERATRAERQREHYGREYRTGLHEQIKTMRSNLDRLEQLKSSYTAYKGFVEKIEKQIAFTQPTIATTTKEHVKTEGLKTSFRVEPVKIITPVESRLKLTLKAEMLREVIPPEYKPRDPIATRTETTLKTELNRTAAISRPINLTNNFREQTIPPTREQSPNIASYKQPIKLEIRELSKAIEERVRASTTRPETRVDPSERKSWFTPASEKTRPMQETITRKMREQQRANPEPQTERPDPSTMRGQFRQSARPEERPRTANYEHMRERTRAEAQTDPPHQDQAEKPRRAKMSEGFNRAASSGYDPEPQISEPNPDDEPEIKT
jgi:hypothetical protein